MKVPKIFLKFNKVDYKNNKNLMFLHQKCIFRKKKFPKSLSVQKLLVPLQPQISKVVFAQMAESVDALVSNTSGAIHPGSIPGLGTKSCKSKDLWLFFLFPTDFTDYTDIFFDTKNLNLCKSVRSVGLFSLSPPSRWRHSSYFTMVLLHNHFDSIYNINA